MNRPTFFTVVGTRPEIIRLSRVIVKLDRAFNHILIHTGQNSDPLLSDVFFSELSIRKPDYFLGIDVSSVGKSLGGTLIGLEPLIEAHKPVGLLVLGDTNSAISAVIAKRMQVPVYHMEAGNRSFDENVPEETNRRLVDHVADFNLPYTEHARRNLLAEGLNPRRVIKTGSPMYEVLAHYLPEIKKSDSLNKLGLTEGQYFLVSAHRQENVDNPKRLQSLIKSLGAVHEHWKLPVIVSTHPRTRRRLEELPAFQDQAGGVKFLEPFGFFDYNRLQMSAKCVISDSGTISEESSILKFPAITIRDSIERPEALEAGAIVLSGMNQTEVIASIETTLEGDEPIEQLPEGYFAPNCSDIVVKAIKSTYHLHRAWSGLHPR
jgi:UDP-N-acetylglucosamine 2-epimerase